MNEREALSILAHHAIISTEYEYIPEISKALAFAKALSVATGGNWSLYHRPPIGSWPASGWWIVPMGFPWLKD